jgi:hypothetical protein
MQWRRLHAAIASSHWGKALEPHAAHARTHAFDHLSSGKSSLQYFVTIRAGKREVRPCS